MFACAVLDAIAAKAVIAAMIRPPDCMLNSPHNSRSLTVPMSAFHPKRTFAKGPLSTLS
jgi:hypothetical protein